MGLGLIAVVIGVVVAVLAVFGIRPRGGKQVSNTQMMTAARIVLIALALALIIGGLR